MKNIPKPVSVESIARLADAGKSVSSFFNNQRRHDIVNPVVSVDFTAPMLEELDNTAKELNINRQAVVKTLVRQALDHHYLAVRGTADR
jgi:regulator of PEP synthase PpsR (kinase-PPPase family)